MLNDIDRGNIDKIVCYRLDRISRNMSDFVRLIDEFNAKGVEFISVSERFDTTVPMGKAMMYISSIFSQLERETIAERIRDNLMELAKTGRWLGGITPTGYKSVEVDNGGVKAKKSYKLEIVEGEAEIVRLIYNKFIELNSITQLETYLMNCDIKTKHNKYYSAFTIKNILTNPVYAVADEYTYNYFENYSIFAEKADFNGTYGVIAYNKTKQDKHKANKINPLEDWVIAVGAHKAIVSGDRWVKVQNMLYTCRGYRKPRSHNALLGGLIYCSCGSVMVPKAGRTGANGVKNYSYICPLKRKSHSLKCQSDNIDGIRLDNKIISIIKELNADKKKLINELEKGRKKLTGNKVVLDLTRKKYIENKKEIEGLVGKLSAINDKNVEKYIVDRISVLDRENSEIEKQIESQKETNTCEISVFNKNITNFASCVDEMSYNEKRSAVRELVDKILWSGESIDVVFKNTDYTVTFSWNNMYIENMGSETSERLKYWRCKRGYLQREVACAVGISRSRYMSYEKKGGNCPAEILAKISEFLGVDFDDVADDYHRFVIGGNTCQKIRSARQKMAMTRAEFAKAVGVCRDSVNRWENKEGVISRRDYFKVRNVTEV